MVSESDSPVCRALLAAMLVVAALAAPMTVDAQTPVTEPQTGAESWWTPAYLVDYGIITAGTAGYVIGERFEPRSEALIGPSYDPDDPTEIFESDEVDRPFVGKGRPGETFPNHWLQGSLAGLFVGVAGLEGARWIGGTGSGFQFHQAVVGFAEAATVTATVTSATKLLFGRLRPDFGDRALRYHCTTEPDRYDEYCEGYRDRPLAETREEAEELLQSGRRSFFSAHASHSFNMFTYTSLLVGGHYVWGEDATTASRIGGILAQAAMFAGAGYMTGTRLLDNRHHPGDLIAGSLAGIGIANVAYWRRFDTRGDLRAADGGADRRLTLQPFGTGPGLAVKLTY